MATLTEPCFDSTGRRIKPGDVLRVWHYKDARTRRYVYMYKLVFAMNGDLRLDPDGEYLTAVDILDIWRVGLAKAHKCHVQDLGECTLIDGADGQDANGSLMCWYDRPREQRPAQ